MKIARDREVSRNPEHLAINFIVKQGDFILAKVYTHTHTHTHIYIYIYIYIYAYMLPVRG